MRSSNRYALVFWLRTLE